MNSGKIFFCLFFLLLSVSVYPQDFWQEVYSGSFQQPTLKISNKDYLYTINDSCLVSSPDQGITWNCVYKLPIPYAISFGTSPTGVIYLNYLDSVKKSYDEGESWVDFQIPYFGGYRWFTGANKEGDIFVETTILSGGYSYRSEDEGETWIKIGITGSFLTSIAFNPQGITYAVYNVNLPQGARRLYSSTNKGDEWLEVLTAPANLYSVYCTGNGDLFAAEYSSPVFYKSTDQGVTWSLIFNQIVNSFAENQEGELFIAVNNAGVYNSTDNGLNWNPLNEGLQLQASTLVNVDSSGYVYVLTGPTNNEQTMIYRSIDPTITTVGVREEPALPGKFLLEQNYPNPFNPVTNIGYSIPERSLVTLKIFDILGNEVFILVNEVQDAGAHNINFNASSFPSGVYYYSLTSGTGTLTGKMLLLK